MYSITTIIYMLSRNPLCTCRSLEMVRIWVLWPKVSDRTNHQKTYGRIIYVTGAFQSRPTYQVRDRRKLNYLNTLTGNSSAVGGGNSRHRHHFVRPFRNKRIYNTSKVGYLETLTSTRFPQVTEQYASDDRMSQEVPKSKDFSYTTFKKKFSPRSYLEWRMVAICIL